MPYYLLLGPNWIQKRQYIQQQQEHFQKEYPLVSLQRFSLEQSSWNTIWDNLQNPGLFSEKFCFIIEHIQLLKKQEWDLFKEELKQQQHDKESLVFLLSNDYQNKISSVLDKNLVKIFWEDHLFQSTSNEILSLLDNLFEAKIDIAYTQVDQLTQQKFLYPEILQQAYYFFQQILQFSQGVKPDYPLSSKRKNLFQKVIQKQKTNQILSKLAIVQKYLVQLRQRDVDQHKIIFDLFLFDFCQATSIGLFESPG